jgi:hypothetical protein
MQPHADLPAAGSTKPANQIPFALRPDTLSTSVKRFTAFGLILLLLPFTQIDLLAQQQPYPGQYDPSQQVDYQQPGYYGQQQPGNPQVQALDSTQLEQLVAPIALNPDPLVALMLAASTYPQQITAADQWRQSMGQAPPDQVAYGANAQNWDPSVKALTAFPQVLAEMDQNMQWTAALGNAYYNEPQDVLQAVQVMRQRAQAAGNLESTPQEAVSYDQGYIQVVPANPQVIYVPAYNPWTVYGQPVAPYPGFSLLGALGSFFNSSIGSSFGSGAVRFGLGIVMSAFSHTPWGLLSWGLNWLTQNLLFHSSNYYSSSPYVADWGLRYGGPRAYLAPRQSFVAYNRGYNRSYGYSQNLVRSPYRYASNYNRNYQTSSYAYNRTQSYNRQSYGSNYGRGFDNRSQLAYNNRQQSPFANHSAYGSSFNSGYRAPSSGFANNGQHFASNNFNQRSNAYTGSSFRTASSSRPSTSGGFHPFGSSHSSNSFGHEQSFKAPKYKAPKAPKSFGGGGGHHSFGGGGHSGGGHSGGHHH